MLIRCHICLHGVALNSVRNKDGYLMTPRQRLFTVLRGEIPDCVPVAPDFSNMIPARMTGKPFWEIYLYNDPPLWRAYVDCANHFDIDALVDGFFPLVFPDEIVERPDWENYIVFKTEERLVTQQSYVENGKRVWNDVVDVYYVDDPPTMRVSPGKVGLRPTPEEFEPVVGVNLVELGPDGFRSFRECVGDRGLVGVPLTGSCAVCSEEGIYEYYDNPDKHEQWAQERIELVEKRFKRIMSLAEDNRPDFLTVGGSGSLVFQTVDIFRQLAFPAVKRGIELAKAAGFPTHAHSCGPEKELVKIFAEETNLTVIDPLEVSPMGDCDLAELKKLYGDKIVLKGNLHTTEVMLHGTVDDVVKASKKAIDDAGANGRFILSTGDQCGRDTPDENIFAMIETARTYGRY